ncbi:MAG: helix-turn-helix domain-containing protein [Promethearchaeota archaeon]
MSSCSDIVKEVLEEALNLLIKSDYHVFENRSYGVDLCFEILARHHSTETPKLLIKVVENIDNLRSHIIAEMKIVSRILEALPMIVGLQNRHSSLENDTLYVRSGLIASNLYTFSRIVTQPTLSLAIAKQGGFFYDIDGEKLSSLREEQGMSRQDLASRLKISSKAISQYETKGMRASKENANMIESILHESVVIPLDFYTYLKDSLSVLKLNNNLQRRVTKKTQEFMKEINEIVSDTGHKVYWTKTAPFDLFIYEEIDDKESDIQYQFVGGTQFDKSKSDLRAKLKRDFLPEIAEHKIDGAIIYNEEFYDEKSAKKYAVPYLFPKELRELENPEKFKKILRKRTRSQNPT